MKNKTVSEPKNTASTTSPRPPLKEEEPKANDQEKCGMGPDCPFCKSQKKEYENKIQHQQGEDITKSTMTTSQRTQIL